MVHRVVYQRIEKRLDELETFLKGSGHISMPYESKRILGQLSNYFQYMNDEQKDFYQCAIVACDEKIEWNSNNKVRVEEEDNAKKT